MLESVEFDRLLIRDKTEPTTKKHDQDHWRSSADMITRNCAPIVFTPPTVDNFATTVTDHRSDDKRYGNVVHRHYLTLRLHRLLLPPQQL